MSAEPGRLPVRPQLAHDPGEARQGRKQQESISPSQPQLQAWIRRALTNTDEFLAWSGNKLQLVGIIAAGCGRRQRLVVQLIALDCLFDNLA